MLHKSHSTNTVRIIQVCNVVHFFQIKLITQYNFYRSGIAHKEPFCRSFIRQNRESSRMSSSPIFLKGNMEKEEEDLILFFSCLELDYYSLNTVVATMVVHFC